MNSLKKNTNLYLLLLPGIIAVFIFCYVPMGGLVIAFQDYNIFKGLFESKWAGLDNFAKLFNSDSFIRVFKNTLLLGIYNIIFGFPVPIVIAILLNEIKFLRVKKIVQNIIYLPHFLSWVIVYGLFVSLFSSSGAFMRLLFSGKGEIPVLLTNPKIFRGILVSTVVWKESGWGTVLYMAAITSIDPQLYEAAYMDGAGRFRRIWHITLPGITPTIILVLIMRIGNLVNAQTEQVLLLLNPLVYETGDVIGTYVYRMGLGKMEYSFSTAVGLFNSVVGFALMISANKLSKKMVGSSLW